MSSTQSEKTGDAKSSTFIISISGPSSSGKTTLARLLRHVFSILDTGNVDDKIESFIIHEDDFYLPDDKIPTIKTEYGEEIQDWDTIDAIDVPFLSSSLAYLRKHGSLPPGLKSKEDFNENAGDGVLIDEAEIGRLRRHVKDWVLQRQRNSSTTTTVTTQTIAFLEGFLLYSPPRPSALSANANDIPKNLYALRPIYQNIHVHLFLPASYDQVKKRREGRSGYATIGPSSSASSTSLPQRSQEDEQGGEDGPANFWVDPPGYVDDVVWPHYVRDHSWLLLSEDGEPLHAAGMEDAELLRKVGQGTNIRTDAGVLIAPCHGSLPIMETLKWAVTEVLNAWEEREKQAIQ